MDAERARKFLLSLPHVIEVEQWGGLLYWVGDKAIGGKTFAMIHPEAGSGLPVSFAAGPERSGELCEIEGMRPAPYSARNFWVAAERWDVLRNAEWEQEFRAGYKVIQAKLAPKTKTALELPARELKRVIAERKKALVARAEAASR